MRFPTFTWNKALLGGLAGGAIAEIPQVRTIVDWIAGLFAGGLARLSAMAGIEMPAEVHDAFAFLITSAAIGYIVYKTRNANGIKPASSSAGGAPLGAIALPLLAGLALGGCSLSPWYAQANAFADAAVEQGIKDRQAWNDRKAKIAFTLPCDVPYGAVRRMGYQEIADQLCPAGPNGQRVAIDVQQLLLLQMLAANPNMLTALQAMPSLLRGGPVATADPEPAPLP
jgi:hypothetical protein